MCVIVLQSFCVAIKTMSLHSFLDSYHSSVIIFFQTVQLPGLGFLSENFVEAYDSWMCGLSLLNYAS